MTCLRPTPVAASGAVGASRAARAAARIAERMRKHPAESFPLAALAHDAGLSRYQLIRAFRAVTGETPHAFVLRLRVERAKALLLAGMSPAAAAHDCGFSDQSHLTSAFRRQVGATPAQFARAAAGASPETEDPEQARRLQ